MRMCVHYSYTFILEVGGDGTGQNVQWVRSQWSLWESCRRKDASYTLYYSD